MDKRALLFFEIVVCGWPIVGLPGPVWVQLLIFLAESALLLTTALYAFNPEWGREYPRLRRRLILALVVVALAVVSLFLLFGERSFETALGRGGRATLFLLYLLVFSVAALFARRLVARR